MTSQRIPTLPAAARKAGAKSIRRTVGTSFSIGYALTDDGDTAPGKGPAVVDALKSAWSDRAEITWKGRQCDPIIVSFR